MTRVIGAFSVLMLGVMVAACVSDDSDPDDAEFLDWSGPFDTFTRGNNDAMGLDSEVLNLALRATWVAQAEGRGDSNILAIMDYSLPSSEKRFWVLDLEDKEVLFYERASHGRNTGTQLVATTFSNVEGSNMSSLGLFECAETGVGPSVGYYVALDGLEPGFNDNARDRELLVHSASYASQDFLDKYGYLGRSLGCVAVRPEVKTEIVDTLTNGALLFGYYPDPTWLAGSTYLNTDVDMDEIEAYLNDEEAEVLVELEETVCTDTCPYADDGDCDDGGAPSTSNFCEYGTDCSDCGSRSSQ